MATITRAELHTVSTPTISTKSLPKLATPAATTRQTTGPTLQRIDVEPIYTALKTAVGENWPLYKESFSLYITGQLNQEELARRIDSFICLDPAREHLHNQLVCAVYSNAQRDQPDPGVATWVSANDKPTTSAKPATGDKAEQRLKTEVMALPPRERARLKALHDDGRDVFTQLTASYHAARQMNKLPDIVPTSVGGYNKTNWEIEIHKRYTQPLFTESNEFPEPDTIQARMVPICYEEGLVKGASSGCSELLNVAAESYVRGLLDDIFQRVRANGATYVKTSKYRRRLDREEYQLGKGQLARNPFGLLPVEADMAAARPPLGLHELRLALDLGNTALNQLRLVSDRVVVGVQVDDEDDGRMDVDEPMVNGAVGGLPKTNGILTNGVGHADGHAEESDWVWQGGTADERDFLGSVLDDCLMTGR